jgi:MinD-like ATPase involved in chromosome partitioning or flagellar assembly
MVERALGGPGQQRNATSWREHVRVVPGGHGPGRPDLERRDRARALLPIPEPRLTVVLGCTVGAGQTVTTLMMAEVLASLRSDTVAALDLNPGQTSLASLARTAPAATVRSLLAGPPPSTPSARGRGHPDIIAHDTAATGEGLSDPDYARLVQTLASRYPLTLADPGASAVARLLAAADQLVLVTPASSEAARAIAMTMEWLDGHGYAELCAGSIAVINGVSKRSMSSAEQAELVTSGRSHATVRVPWDDHLVQAPAGPARPDGQPPAGSATQLSQLSPQAQHAYTALAGVLVSALTNAGSAKGGEQRRASR